MLRGDVFRFNRLTRTPTRVVLGLIPGTLAAEELNRGLVERRRDLVEKALLDDAPWDELTHVVGAYDLEKRILPEEMLKVFKMLKVYDQGIEPAARHALSDMYALWIGLRDDYIALHTQVFDIAMAQWFHPTEGHRHEVAQLFNAMFLQMVNDLYRLIEQDALTVEHATTILRNIQEVHRNSHRVYLPRLIAA